METFNLNLKHFYFSLPWTQGVTLNTCLATSAVLFFFLIIQRESLETAQARDGGGKETLAAVGGRDTK